MKIEGHQSNLALFAPVKVDTGIDKIEWVDYRPISQITAGCIIDFQVAGHGQNYIDLQKSKLYIKVRIVKKDGTPLTPVDKVGFVNLPHASLFKHCEIQLQHVTIDNSNNYAYKGILKTLLNNSEDVLESKCQSELFYKDTSGFMSDPDGIEGANFGLVQRSVWTLNSRMVEMEGSIHSGIFEQNRLLPNGISVNIRFSPSPDSFALMAQDPNYSVEIIDAKLKVCHVKINSDIIVAHAETMRDIPALIPYTDSNIKAFSIPSGILSWNGENIYTGDVPKRVIVAMTTAESFSGSFTEHPFNFQHFNVSSIGFYVDGISLPSQPMKPNFKEKNYVEPYLRLFTGQRGNYINREEFSKGYTIYVFDIDNNDSNFTSQHKYGHTRLGIEFAEPLPTSASVIVYSEFNKILEIDYARNVTLKM